MVILLYGMNVARSIIEEKTSRVFEVLLATIRPEEMMAGKVIGVGAVGLTQVAVWLLTAIVLTSALAHRSLSPAASVHVSLNAVADHLLRRLLPARLPALLHHRRRARRHDQLRAGAPAAQHVPRHAACRLHVRARSRHLRTPAGLLAKSSRSSPSARRCIMYLRISLGHACRMGDRHSPSC